MAANNTPQFDIAAALQQILHVQAEILRRLEVHEGRLSPPTLFSSTPAPSLFGSTPATSLFGSTPATTTSPLSFQSSTAPASSAPASFPAFSFGSSPFPSPSFFLAATTPASSPLFGAAPSTTPPHPFSSSASTPLFGATTASSTPTSSPLFGATAASSSPTPSPILGATTASTTQASSPFFGSSTASSAPSFGFGSAFSLNTSSSSTTTSTTAGILGQSPGLTDSRPQQQRPPPANKTSDATDLMHPDRPIRHLTQAEMADRRKKGLCFNCDEPYIRGHRCKHLFFLDVVDDDEETSYPDIPPDAVDNPT